MYFIDLSIRNPIQGYVDSLDLIREAIPDAFDHYADEMREVISTSPPEDITEYLHFILEDAELLAAKFGICAVPHDGFYYVMTNEEWEAFDVD